MKKNKTYLDGLVRAAEMISEKQELCGKKILVTGASGLIGSAVVDMLLSMQRSGNSSDCIWAAGREKGALIKRFGEETSRLRYLQYDATQPFEWDTAVDYVIHCASNAHPEAYVKYPVETMMANFYGVQQLLKYGCKIGMQRFLYVSSSEIYGNKPNTELYKEDAYYAVDILNPRSCYPSSKRAAETLCASYLQEYSVDSVIVRPGHIYGPNMTRSDSRAYAQFARDALAGRDIVLKSAGGQLRSYCYVTDCASAILSVLCAGKKGEAYNISNPDSVVTIRQLAEAISEEAGVKLRFETPGEEEKKGYNLMSCSALNSEKLQNLGWKGLYTLKNGVKEMLETMRGQ